MKVEINLVEDLKQDIKQRLTTEGFSWESGLADEDICVHFVDLMRKWPKANKRQVHRSKEFSFPSDHKEGIDQIQKKIESGQDIKGHLSRQLKDITYNDAMLNEWGVLHFHLGTKTGKTGFVNRTKSLLYAMFRPMDAYFIQVLDHGHWTDTQLVQIVEANWPDVISSSRLSGVKALRYSLSPADRQTLRDNNINALVVTDSGGVYAPMAMGQSMTGGSVAAMMEWQRWRKDVEEFEQHLKNPQNWDSELREAVKRSGGKACFRLLTWNTNGLAAEEAITSIVVCPPEEL